MAPTKRWTRSPTPPIRAADAIGEKGAQLQDLQEEWMENVRGYINEHPVKSVGIAIAGGFLLSRLLSGR
jgi:ElaB/YqjD/DUF883 family membrane-anchored ribosome-binding protein